jgi:hypothetical protein
MTRIADSMKTQRPIMRSRALTCAAILAALAVGCVAPTRGFATCGDYVTMNSHGSPSEPRGMPRWLPGNSGMVGHNAPPLRTAAILAGAGAMAAPLPCGQCPDRSESPARMPCQGPWCSGSNTPMTPPTAVVETLHEPWALCCSSAILSLGDSISHLFLRGHSDRVHRVFPIYHPPRWA